MTLPGPQYLQPYKVIELDTLKATARDGLILELVGLGGTPDAAIAKVQDVQLIRTGATFTCTDIAASKRYIGEVDSVTGNTFFSPHIF